MTPARTLAFAALALAPAAAGAAPPPHVVNARVETHDARGGLPAVFDRLVSAGGPAWIAYAAPVVGRGHGMCCWSSRHEAGRDCGGCRLEGGDGAFTVNDASTVALEGDRVLVVLFRTDGARVQRVRTLSWSCGLDAGGLPLRWIENVEPAQSLRLLAGLAEAGRPGAGRDGSEGQGSVMAAIALHAHPDADVLLERFAAAGPLERRKQAVFWMGVARGRRGFETLRRIARQDAAPELREHAVFALSQSDVPEAVDVMLQVAREDAATGVRGQALFWLGQKAGAKAVAGLERAMADDPDAEVREKAVFALSQLPKDEGVPLLIRTARTHRDPRVRKKAMFWLGQSEDARALAFFAEVLGR